MKVNTINLIGQIADLKDTDYKNTLAIASLIELLIDKNYFSREEFTKKAQELETATVSELILKRRQNRLQL